MQIFVNRSDLDSGGDVPIIAVYDDNIEVVSTAHGDGAIKLNVPAAAVQGRGERGIPGTPVLARGWRDTYKAPIVSAEATQRIDDVFPEYSQRNSVAEMNGYIMTYGTDTARWPAEARGRKTEIDRCWSYINAVRAKAGNLMGAALPADPSNNAHWPTRISIYQPAP